MPFKHDAAHRHRSARARMLMIAAGQEDGNDAGRLRRDPMVKLAMGRLADEADLCSQPILSLLETEPRPRSEPQG